MGNSRFARIGVPLILIAVWLCATTFLVGLGILPNKSSPGLKALGTSVAMKSGSDVEELVTTRIEEIYNTDIELYYGVKRYRAKIRDTGYRLDKDKIVQRITSFGNSGGFFDRIYKRISARRKGYLITLAGASRMETTDLLNRMDTEIGIPPKNARYEIGWGKPDYPVEGSSGREINVSKLERRISYSLLKGDRKVHVMAIPLRVVKPRIRISDIRGMVPLAEYSTKFDPTVTNRVHNMRISTERLHGQFIEPEQVWSLNGVIGPREISRGFKEATVILEGKFVPGIGGGVSQVTTTIYNACLLAGLGIREHFTHTIPITYVPFGMDATAVYGEKDLKVHNPYRSLVSISAGLMNDTVIFKVYGFDNGISSTQLLVNVEEKYEPKVKTVQDDAIRLGYTVTEVVPVPGYRISIDRIIKYKDGKEVREPAAATGWYRTIEGVVRVGVNPEGVIPATEVTQPVKPVPAPDPLNGYVHEAQTDVVD